jgi:hypothetical protein
LPRQPATKCPRTSPPRLFPEKEKKTTRPLPVSLEFLGVRPEDWERLKVGVVTEQQDLEPRVRPEMMLAQGHEIIVAEIEVGQLIQIREGVLMNSLEIIGAQVKLVQVGNAV